MNTIQANTKTNTSSVEKIMSGLFGVAVVAAGYINLFWGSESGFGVFLLLLSLLYFLPVNKELKKATVVSIPITTIVKLVLGVLTTWVILGEGELFTTIAHMHSDL